MCRHARRGGGPGTAAAGAITLATLMAVVCPPAARAQPAGPGTAASDEELSLERVVAGVAELLFSLADSGTEKVFQFLETVELFERWQI